MSLKTVFFMIGLLLISLAMAMLIPAGLSFFVPSYEESAFFLSAGATGFIGILLTLANMQARERMLLGVREAFILTSLSWATLAIFSALPFMLCNRPLHTTDAFFETISAITTTGSTVIKQLDRTDAALLLWRALLQWLGGVGIIVTALTVLPILKIGGMQLFRTETSDRFEKILPRASQVASSIFGTLTILTLFFTGALWLAGMKLFDALCHAMSALATGGLSTSDSSIAYFQNPLVELLLMLAMVIGGCTLILFIRAWNGDWRPLFKDHQIRGFLRTILLCSAFLTVWRYFHTPDPDILNLLRETSFSVISAITSTGFTSTDLALWDPFGTLFLFLLIFVGACTGSTAGGIKIFRFQVLYALVKTQIAQLRRPHGVFIPHYGQQTISKSVMNSVFTFLALFIVTFAAITVLLTACGVDLATSVTATMSALCNAGTGIISTSKSGAPFPDPAKWLLMFAMLLGRLEMLTILILFVPSFWRK